MESGGRSPTIERQASGTNSRTFLNASAQMGPPFPTKSRAINRNVVPPFIAVVLRNQNTSTRANRSEVRPGNLIIRDCTFERPTRSEKDSRSSRNPSRFARTNSLKVARAEVRLFHDRRPHTLKNRRRSKQSKDVPTGKGSKGFAREEIAVGSFVNALIDKFRDLLQSMRREKVKSTWLSVHARRPGDQLSSVIATGIDRPDEINIKFPT